MASDSNTSFPLGSQSSRTDNESQARKNQKLIENLTILKKSFDSIKHLNNAYANKIKDLNSKIEKMGYELNKKQNEIEILKKGKNKGSEIDPARKVNLEYNGRIQIMSVKKEALDKLFGIGISNVELYSIASSMGCLASHFPCIYLGLPIGANMSRCNNWKPLVDKFHKRLSKWKSKSLSIVISPRVNGGLGIGSLRITNQALLFKWWWRFCVEDQALWCKVIRSIHGPLGGLFDSTTVKYKSGPWYYIMKLKEDLQRNGINLPSMFKRKVGNGQSTSFWNNIWLGGPSLSCSFPRLYRVDANPNCLVSK
ncbi:RNA-directed DNA polymerase, eukaryota, Reverse transcriptase zinc-binding domain protein [Artemisia annua]|uniref:RNA-directed DNA polymerase, eukaryota, Reverse transcriptase zinc-binding domain protein n=1 Tax=Artemisia annua TaxID=35608 RepID=A0A2U1N4A3_ARTAN|nr:RNA-directed DNA polymerase, eukaryota, Reverse transcriptase zinc-binding domain protein [Artemisia annua]